MSDTTRLPSLAPLQKVMLGDALAAPLAGHHVEQLEIHFSPGVSNERVAAAWAETVARTDALRISFTFDDPSSPGRAWVEPEPALHLSNMPPASWADWLIEDRCRPLLAPGTAPWRAVYWPEA